MDDRLTGIERAAEERFARLGGLAAIAGAGLSLLYAIAFVVLKDPLLSAVALMAGGLASAVALFAVYRRVLGAGPVSTLGFVLGFAGTIGAAIHGAYDLAIVVNPTEGALVGPHPVDPRGFLTFGVAGLGVILLSWAGLIAGGLPRMLLQLGLVFGVLLIAIYLGRLIILDPSNPLVLGPAAITGLIVSPLWYGWLGWLLLTRRV